MALLLPKDIAPPGPPPIDDSDLVNRLLDAGVTMDEVLPESPSILMTLLLSYVVPIVIFIFIGRWLSKKIMSSMGGGPGGECLLAKVMPRYT